MERTATFEVVVSGTKGGQPMMPEDFNIKALRELLTEVEVLLFPGSSSRDRPVISYEVQPGSVRNLFRTGVQAVAQTSAVLALVASSGTIDMLEPRTARAIEAMQRWAQEGDVAFALRTSLPGSPELIIDRTTHYLRTEAVSVETELYLYGRVVDAGGKERSNIHLQVDGQGIHVIDASKEFLEGLDKNILYHRMGVRAMGRQNLQTGEIEKNSLKLLELIDYDEHFEEAYLKRLQAKARGWLKDTDPDQYLNDVRGTYGS
ncbi:MAG: hypothetical protein H6590_04670 [Flavobacteriales bacterium]|nr:hypothetical protein [Flavobacteriales bacterium]